MIFIIQSSSLLIIITSFDHPYYWSSPSLIIFILNSYRQLLLAFIFHHHRYHHHHGSISASSSVRREFSEFKYAIWRARTILPAFFVFLAKFCMVPLFKRTTAYENLNLWKEEFFPVSSPFAIFISSLLVFIYTSSHFHKCNIANAYHKAIIPLPHVHYQRIKDYLFLYQLCSIQISEF